MGRTQIIACLIVGLWAAASSAVRRNTRSRSARRISPNKSSSARSWRSIWNIGLAAPLIVSSTWAARCWRTRRSCTETSISIPNIRDRADDHLEVTARHDPVRPSISSAREYQARFGLEWMDPLGFNNTFAMVIRGDEARKARLQR